MNTKRLTTRAAIFALGATLAFTGFRAFATAPKGESSGKLDSLSWMVGAWRSEPGAPLVEEHWSRDANGSMLGMCRLGSDPQRSTYELILIEREGDSTVMTVRHFGSGLAGKEGHDGKFTLIKQSKEQATFELPKIEFPRRLVYHRTGASSLLIRLEGTNKGKDVAKDLPLHRAEDSN